MKFSLWLLLFSLFFIIIITDGFIYIVRIEWTPSLFSKLLLLSPWWMFTISNMFSTVLDMIIVIATLLFSNLKLFLFLSSGRLFKFYDDFFRFINDMYLFQKKSILCLQTIYNFMFYIWKKKRLLQIICIF